MNMMARTLHTVEDSTASSMSELQLGEFHRLAAAAKARLKDAGRWGIELEARKEVKQRTRAAATKPSPREVALT